ncbi:GNAT domain and Acyl-CoA N-acyltransferase domain-containing protein [Strongyloides ratti]|uniref:GNAT domain and Acyl-CoA N-acyltransferase domain-containing protein n=1 Tax=Strongyloides ratti TaxID=34506 RepID=A0A090L1E4_STRRB|nr:GNAT domain and Acyl-CoA N-acyltransferase domain-containing protein [Strongyloides ratti]CEF63521.1 GNAT domain and Acyl-CoA N-acyltransferase domain-containing protein [Strongyloides ratti]
MNEIKKINDLFSIKSITSKDASEIRKMIKELADYEKLGSQMILTDDDIKNHIDMGILKGFIVVLQKNNNEIAGMLLYYIAYSSWKGPFYFLEDIYVKNDYRKQNIGRHLFYELIQVARKNNIKKISWSALKWNTPAINFYKKIGAENLTETEDRNYIPFLNVLQSH